MITSGSYIFLNLALRLAAALADIHAQGIVHKNIKIKQYRDASRQDRQESSRANAHPR